MSQPEAGTAASCRGCSKRITRLGCCPLWADDDGITVCVKVPLSGIAHGQAPDYVFHQPMPEGLRGSPEQAVL
jgi:hypothetical protein